MMVAITASSRHNANKEKMAMAEIKHAVFTGNVPLAVKSSAHMAQLNAVSTIVAKMQAGQVLKSFLINFKF